MLRKFIIVVLFLLSLGFMLLTAQRSTMDYNENGIYFDGTVTYSQDALLVYGILAGLLLISTLGVLLVRKNKP